MSSAGLSLRRGPSQISFKTLATDVTDYRRIIFANPFYLCNPCSLLLTAFGRLCFQERHVAILGEQSAVIETQRSGGFVDGLQRFDLVARDRSALFEPSRRHQHASLERAHSTVVRVNGAIESASDVVEVFRERAQSI